MTGSVRVLPTPRPPASDEGPLWPWVIYGLLSGAVVLAFVAGAVVLLRKLVGG